MGQKVATVNFWQLLLARQAQAWPPPMCIRSSNAQSLEGWVENDLQLAECPGSLQPAFVRGALRPGPPPPLLGHPTSLSERLSWSRAGSGEPRHHLPQSALSPLLHWAPCPSAAPWGIPTPSTVSET